MMAPQEFTKVPGNERESGSWMQAPLRMSRRRNDNSRQQLNFSSWCGNPAKPPWMRVSSPVENEYSLLLQDGEDYRLCNDKAVWVHHAVLATYLSYTGNRTNDVRDDFLWLKPVKFLLPLSVSYQLCRFWSVLWWGWASLRPERCTWWRL